MYFYDFIWLHFNTIHFGGGCDILVAQRVGEVVDCLRVKTFKTIAVKKRSVWRHVIGPHRTGQRRF